MLSPILLLFLVEVGMIVYGARLSGKSFNPENWSDGVGFIEDKEVARNIALYENLNVVKYKIEPTKIYSEAQRIDILNNRKLLESLKAQGYDTIRCVAPIYIPSINRWISAAQYLVFNPSIVNEIDFEKPTQSLKESLVVHNQLNPNLFAHEQLLPDVREHLIGIADKFVGDLADQGLPCRVLDYWLVGSNAAYNYQPDSDIDIHVILDTTEIPADPQILRILLDYAKSAMMKNYQFTIKSQPVEIYFEDQNASAVSDGVYSIKSNRWIKKATPRQQVKLYPELTPEFDQWLQRYHSLQDDEIQQFIDDLYLMRKESLATDGEFGLGNLIFKEFRNTGRLQTLKDRLKTKETQQLSLESLQEASK